MKLFFMLIFPIVLMSGCANSAKESVAKQKGATQFVRNAHSMAYDRRESKIYLFGGANEKEVLSDLWLLDSTNWRKVMTNRVPEPRTFAPLIYDDENNRLILFGGSKVLFGKSPEPRNLLNDTWQFKNSEWKKLITSNAPTPRAEAVMVYDKARKTIVLFGGYYIQNGEYIKLQDTWEFYNHDWHLASNEGPSARHGISMAFDSKTQSVLLFGGSTVDGQYGESKGETWKWNGNGWSQLEIVQPSGIFNASMVYDQEESEVIRFGGWNGKSRINETWSFRNNQWSKLDLDTAPSLRNHSAMIYDENGKRIVLFGGHDGKNVFGDTWVFTNHQWKKISESKPIERVNNGH